MQYGHIVRAVFGQPWAITPEALDTIAEIVRLRASGSRLDEEEIRLRLGAAAAAAGPRSGRAASGSVGVIPVYGVIMQRASLMSDMSGGTSIERLTASFRQAMADDSIGSILLDVDSPGGEVGGVEELAAEIRAARGAKPIVAVANTLMASAAYWIASAADEIVATPSSMTGSIGVRTTHTDISAALEQAGVKVTNISAGKFKTEGDPSQPLGENALAHLEEMCGDYYGLFVNAVAKGRGVSAAAVRSGYGEGRVLTAQRAKDAGLVDRVDTFDNTVRRAATGRASMRADADGFRYAAGTGEPMTGIEISEGGTGDIEGDPDGEPPPAVVQDRDPAAAALALARARLGAS